MLSVCLFKNWYTAFCWLCMAVLFVVQVLSHVGTSFISPNLQAGQEGAGRRGSWMKIRPIAHWTLILILME